MRISNLSILLISSSLTLITGCGTEEPLPVNVKVFEDRRVEIVYGDKETEIAIGDQISTVKSKLGDPCKSEITSHRYYYLDEIVEIAERSGTFGYSGTVGSIIIYKLSKEYAGRFFLEQAMTDKGIKIGSSRNSVLQAYGNPPYPSSDYDSYDAVVFYYDSNDKVDIIKVR